MDDSLLQEMEEARERGEDLAPYLARMERCRWDHDVTDCEICRGAGILPAQECVFKLYNMGTRSQDRKRWMQLPFVLFATPAALTRCSASIRAFRA
jgi:hypothetical protein